jgi:diguanylate cyclase
MQQKLSTRITVQYMALFSATLIAMALVVYLAVRDYAQTTVRNEMTATSQVYQRLWALKSESQATNATLLASDFGFKTAMALQDQATLLSAFDNLRRRVNADTGVVIAANGAALTPANASEVAEFARVLNTQDSYDTLSGILRLQDKTYAVVAAPVLSPDLTGWVVFASSLDRKALSSLESLSSIALNAQILTRGKDGQWHAQSDSPLTYRADDINHFINSHLTARKAGILPSPKGRMIAAATPLPGLDKDQQSVLMLSYPLADALKAYHPLLTLLLGMAVLALGLIVVSSLYLARSLTRPIRTLTDAAGRLQSGHIQLVKIDTRDEMEDLARAFNNMAVAIEDRESRILHLARHDLASNLPNRSALEDYMDGILARTGDQALIAFAIGIERFSHVRAVWGANIADGLFEVLARTLLLDYPSAWLARLNTDTLGLVLTHDDHAAALAAAPIIAKTISHRLDARFMVLDRSLDITVTVGFAASGQRSLPAAERLERAIIALDQSRAAKLKYLAFSTGIYDALSDNLLLTEQLHTALERGELSVHYQPKYNYRTQRLDSAEALVRWDHKDRGMVSPMKFVLIAEETGYIRDLTLQVMQKVLEDQALLKAEGFEVEISINYSGRLLSDEVFIETTLELLQEAQGRICLEITETAVIEDPKLGLQAMERFVAAGIDISIDDFGTGLSSLSYLKMIPAQELKIDRSFIKDIEASQKDALLVRSTIDLGHGLGMKITAEGVESEETLAMLAGMGCDMAQGYGIARPMALSALIPFLRLKSASPVATPARTKPASVHRTPSRR